MGEEQQMWADALRAALETLPADYRSAHDKVVQMRKLFLAEVAEALAPKLNEHLQSLPHESYAEKRAITHQINQDLRQLNLCTVCPQTQQPSILIADYRDHAERTSRFRFQSSDSSGRLVRKNACHDLPALRLTEAPAREENFATERKPTGGRE